MVEQVMNCNPVESRRTLKIKEVMGKALDCAVEGISFSDVRECFPELSEGNGDVVDDLCGQVLKKLRSNCEYEFDRVCQETDLPDKLALLDQLMEDQPVGADGTRRPPLEDALDEGRQALLQARRTRVDAKKQQIEALRAMTAQSDNELASLQTQVEQLEQQQQQRAEQEQARARAAEQLMQQRMQQLQERVRAVQAAAQGQ